MNTKHYTICERSSGDIAIRGNLTFDTAGDILSQLECLFSTRQTICFDLADVNQCDSAGLGLLIHWFRRAKQESVVLRYKNIPEQLRAIAEVSSVVHILHI